MKILVLGDIHGRTLWKEIIKKELPDYIIYLGDYVSTHEDISTEQQILNLEDILNYKDENPDKVVLLRGNHDIQHLGYTWAECSGLNKDIYNYMSQENFKNKFLKLTQWVYIYGNILFSHAGVSQIWMNNSNIKCVEDINKLGPSELFGFIPSNPFDCYGDSPTQPPTWIRPRSLARHNIKGYTQVIGHTPVNNIVDTYKCTRYNEHIWLCDALNREEYLIIENGVFTPTKYR